ncbi:MAG: phage head-tail connector protein, partial [Paracoccaceae bacterium]
MPIENIVTLTEIRDHLALTGDQTQDDMLIQGKLDAAHSLIERMLGFRILDRF